MAEVFLRRMCKLTRGEVIGQIAAVAVLHHEKDELSRLLALEQLHHILVVAGGQLLENLDLLLQQILRPLHILLRDSLDRHLLLGVLWKGKRERKKEHNE